jgi:diaminopimelate decarboxylase
VDHFTRRDGGLACEDVQLADIAARFGTPTYVYSRATIARHVQVLGAAMSALPHLVCYAVKANANLAVLELLRELGCGFDAVSVGELARVQKAGGDPARTILSGVGKRDDEIEAALAAGVLYVSVESAEELDAIARSGRRARVSIRVNPDVDAKTHPYIATGMAQNKFGVPLDEARALYRRALGISTLEMVGVTCHIGSQVTELGPFEDAARRMSALARELLDAGVPLRFVGMGGGLGIPYQDETPPPPERYGAALTSLLGPLGLTVVLEPGRVIVGNAGVLLARVVRRKSGKERRFVLVDAGMNDLIRPALYGARHRIEPVGPARGAPEIVDVVGPVCESADTFAKSLELPRLESGDLVAVRSAGAYGFAMSSQYNARPRAAEVLVDGARAVLVRRRETLEELWRGESSLDGTPITGD